MASVRHVRTAYPPCQKAPDAGASLSEPVRFPRSGLTSRNRTVLAAMTNRQSHADGTLSEEEIRFLLMRAEGGFGIVTTACAHVSADGQGFPGELGVFADRHVPQLKRLADGLRERGALSVVQIFHAGLRAPESLTGVQPLAPSAQATQDARCGAAREMTPADIQRIVEDHALAAGRIAAAGCDGIELHGAHGYLINQFLGRETNARRDAWGGVGRPRFLQEVLTAVRRAVPPHMIVGLRISPEKGCGFTLAEAVELCAALCDQLDFLHLSCWDSFQPSQANPRLTITQVFRAAIPGLPPVITTGSVWDGRQAAEVLRQGADLVGVGRAAIANPSWASEVIANPRLYRPLQPPFTEEDLERRCGLSPVFVYYMRRWHFVKGRDGSVLEFEEGNWAGVKR